MRWLPLLALVACDYSQDTDETDGPGSTPVCDGRQQTEETEIDAPFDQDGDGFFDASDEGCAATWQPNQLDCDDSDPAVNPAALEIPCNGVDEDCREASADNADNDEDGVGVCDDCNDSDPDVSPEAEEECFDGLDNDCDGIQDNDCGEDYNGIWTITPNDINYSCGFLGQPLVDLDFNELFITYFPPNLTMSSATSGQPPGIDGTVDPNTGDFSAEIEIGTMVGSCTEYYRVEGVFTSATTMEGTFTYNFSNTIPGACTGCATPETVHEFTAVKQ